MTVTMQSSNLSSLIPGVSVYNANLVLAGGSTGSSYGSTVSFTASGIKPGQVWFIKAMANNTGPGGLGAYGLLVNFGSTSQSPIAAPNTSVAAQSDQNPTTTPMGTGWMINGRYLPFSGDIQGERGTQGKPGNDNGIGRITIGSLVGYGDQLEAGGLRGHAHGAGGGLDASGRHHPGDLQRGWVAPALDGIPAALLTPPTIVIGVHSRRAWAGATSHLVRVASRRAEAAPVQAVDSALEGWRSDGSLAMRPFPSRPEDGNHPRGHRTTAHTIGDSPP